MLPHGEAQEKVWGREEGKVGVGRRGKVDGREEVKVGVGRRGRGKWG